MLKEENPANDIGDRKPVTDYPQSLSANAIHTEPVKLSALIELLEEGDYVYVNHRKQKLVVRNVSDAGERRDVLLKGNGATYTLTTWRNDLSVEFLVGQDREPEEVEIIRVRGRNLFNISQYEYLLSEEVELQGTYEQELTLAGSDLEIVKDALAALIAQHRQREQFEMYYRDWLPLWVRVHDRDEWTFYGMESGIVGAAIDYAVEDETLPVSDDLREQARSLRKRLR